MCLVCERSIWKGQSLKQFLPHSLRYQAVKDIIVNQKAETMITQGSVSAASLRIRQFLPQ